METLRQVIPIKISKLCGTFIWKENVTKLSKAYVLAVKIDPTIKRASTYLISKWTSEYAEHQRNNGYSYLTRCPKRANSYYRCFDSKNYPSKWVWRFESTPESRYTSEVLYTYINGKCRGGEAVTQKQGASHGDPNNVWSGTRAKGPSYSPGGNLVSPQLAHL